jgi:hypothetical protein
MWAEVTGSAIALANVLMDNGRWDDVHRIAGFLDAADEPTAARDIRTRADAAAKRANDAQLAQIHPTMTEPEIVSAIEALRECKTAEAASFYIRDLALAMLTIAPATWKEDYVYNFGDRPVQIMKWYVQAGSRIARNAYVAEVQDASRYNDPHSWGFGFPAVISELFVANGAVVTGSVTLASVIRIPDPIAGELEQHKPSTEKVFERLDILARIFNQIQAENSRR